MKIQLEINTCKECPFFEEKPAHTLDSFERPHDWFCKKAKNRKIAGYVEWYDESDVEIPKWCPIKV